MTKSSNGCGCVWKWLTGLLLLSTLTGCLTLGTLTTEQIAERYSDDIIAEVCLRWTPGTYDSLLDTPLTVAERRRHNAARAAFCKGEMK